MAKGRKGRFADFLGFGSNDDYDEEEGYFGEDEEDEEQEEQPSRRERDPYDRDARARRTRRAKVVPIQTSSNIMIFSPKTYNDAQGYVKQLIQHKHIIVKFDKVKTRTAQRILDFMSGATYACDAHVTEIAKNSIYMFAFGQTIVENEDIHESKTEAEGFTIEDYDN